MPNVKNQPVPVAGPNSIEAEQQLLCCILNDSNVQSLVVTRLEPDDFYLESHKVLYKVIKPLVNANKTTNLITVIDILRREAQLEQAGGVDYITKVNDLMLSSAKYKEYFDIVKRCSEMRKIIDACSAVTRMAYSSSDVPGVISYAEALFSSMSNVLENVSLVPLGDVAKEMYEELGRKSANPEQFRGIYTGYPSLDRRTSGFHGGELIIVAARPSVGKSTLAMNMAENIAKGDPTKGDGKAVAIFSLEMTNKQLVERLLASLSGVPLEQIKTGKIEGRQSAWHKLSEAVTLIRNMSLFGNDSSNTRPSEIYSQCKLLKKQGKLDIIFIDYIGLMASDSDYKDGNRQQEIASISRALKNMAKELDVPIVALSQVKREVETRNVGGNEASIKPVLSDLRESGAIEQDADIVMFIHRDKERNHELIIAKHRNGECGSFPLTFIGSQVKFVDTANVSGSVLGQRAEGNEEAPAYTGEVQGYDSADGFSLENFMEGNGEYSVDEAQNNEDDDVVDMMNGQQLDD